MKWRAKWGFCLKEVTRSDKCFKRITLAAMLRIGSNKGKDGGWGTSQECTIKIQVRDNDSLDQEVEEVLRLWKHFKSGANRICQ